MDSRTSTARSTVTMVLPCGERMRSINCSAANRPHGGSRLPDRGQRLVDVPGDRRVIEAADRQVAGDAQAPLGGDSEHRRAVHPVAGVDQQCRGGGGGDLCLNSARWNMAVEPIHARLFLLIDEFAMSGSPNLIVT